MSCDQKESGVLLEVRRDGRSVEARRDGRSVEARRDGRSVVCVPGKKLSDLERVTSLKVYNWFANRRKEIKRRANIEATILESHGIDVQSPGGHSNSDDVDGNDFSEQVRAPDTWSHCSVPAVDEERGATSSSLTGSACSFRSCCGFHLFISVSFSLSGSASCQPLLCGGAAVSSRMVDMFTPRLPSLC
ncbi:Homeobox-containing protein 1 [Liparis tanakae]|uniref:Homeobox-containing protein 1 n=1 Tax=Liparis tanakae TaxID=230148 RepID=A0A4Z2EI02_9TELE|nr:Homeobox-containing protein 1 [Liparis tanakae]